jgi:hypothetical protein
MHSWHDLPELAAATVQRADEWMRKCELAQKRADEAERLLKAEREIAAADKARAEVQIGQWKARAGVTTSDIHAHSQDLREAREVAERLGGAADAAVAARE